MNKIEKLRSLIYHDSSPLKLSFDFDKQSFEMTFERDSIVTRLLFCHVSDISFGSIHTFNEYIEIEIDSADFELLDSSMKARFIFLLGFGKPSWEVSFSFQDIQY